MAERRDLLDRRSLLLLTLGAAAQACRSRVPGDIGDSPEESVLLHDPTTRIAGDLAAYDGQGIHRTGTAVDLESAGWLQQQVRAGGAEAVLEAVPVARLDTVRASVQVATPGGEQMLDGVPLFQAPGTGPAGVRGRLAPFGSGDGIGFGPVGPSPLWSPEYFRARGHASERAHLLVTGGAPFGLPEGYALINAEGFEQPQGPPSLQLPSQALPVLEAAAGSEVVVTTHVERTPVEAFNVLVELPGRDAEAAPVVVMTPRSGWWQCAAERGGGIVVWLELVRHFAARPPRRRLHFVASTGHELGHLGLEHFLESRRSWIPGARAWIHLGANFVAAHGADVRLQSSDEELRRLALLEMGRVGEAPDTETAPGERPLGEARNVFDGEGRYLSILGRNHYFHHPQDRWPSAVDLDKAVRLSAAWVAIVSALAES